MDAKKKIPPCLRWLALAQGRPGIASTNGTYFIMAKNVVITGDLLKILGSHKAVMTSVRLLLALTRWMVQTMITHPTPTSVVIIFVLNNFTT
jgi:hypothetical protein